MFGEMVYVVHVVLILEEFKCLKKFEGLNVRRKGFMWFIWFVWFMLFFKSQLVFKEFKCLKMFESLK
jgi:hypothetical protein